MFELYYSNELIPIEFGKDAEKVGEYETYNETFQALKNYLKENNLELNKYFRTAWDPEKNEIYIDYGSWSRFFNIRCNSEDMAKFLGLL